MSSGLAWRWRRARGGAHPHSPRDPRDSRGTEKAGALGSTECDQLLGRSVLRYHHGGPGPIDDLRLLIFKRTNVTRPNTWISGNLRNATA
jgi:hypothetical protein